MKKRFCFLLLCLLLLNTVGISAQTDTYQIGDVTVPFQEGCASRLHQLGLFEGSEIGFELGEPVTRAQAATMVIRLLGDTSETAENPFEDMQGHWAQNAVSVAASQGYVKGVSATAFGPERVVTGREFATMLLRALGYAAEPDTAYELGIASELLLNRYTSTAVSLPNYTLIRNDLVNLCDGALFAKTADGDFVHQLLIEKGVFSRELWSNTMACGTPSAASVSADSFAWKMNEQMPQERNYMFSPFSIKLAFAMAANGADGQTQQELLHALDITDLNAFNQRAAQWMQSAQTRDDVQLQIANALWRNTDKLGNLPFAPNYLSTLRTDYQATAADVTNANAVQTINRWVNEQTHGKIDSIVQDSNFYAMLVNAVYFKGAWADPFSTGATRSETFTNLDGTESELPFMHYTRYLDYYADDTMQMIRLPYRGGDVSMYVALSEDSHRELETAIPNMISTHIALSLPKFRVEFSTSLNDMMQTLGVQTAFDSNAADFSPMLGQKLLFIDQAVHKTYIDIDEKGTEAAAVTGMMAGGTSAPVDEPIEFNANRPFTYFIRDDVSGEILFLGRFAFAQE